MDDSPTNYPRQTGELDSIAKGSLMLAAAIYKTGKVYRSMTPEEIQDFESYVVKAVKVNPIPKAKTVVWIGGNEQ